MRVVKYKRKEEEEEEATMTLLSETNMNRKTEKHINTVVYRSV